jgi:hypothetical protein
MPPFGHLPRSEDDGRDVRDQIWPGLGLLLLLPLLRWLEEGVATSSIVFPNNQVAASFSSSMDFSPGVALLASRGGMGEGGPGAGWWGFSSLLADHGGEEEQKRISPILFCGEGSCPLCRREGCFSSSSPLPSLTCRGGKTGRDGRTSWILPRRRLPAGCYGASSELLCANHALILVDSAILGRHGGPSATSRSEASLPSCWNSASRFHQVVRPWWSPSVQR